MEEAGVALGIDHHNFTAEEVRSRIGKSMHIQPLSRCFQFLLHGLQGPAFPPLIYKQVSAKLHRLASEPSFRQSVGRLRDLNLVGSGPASRAADVIESELLVHSSQLLRPIESVTPWWVEVMATITEVT
jgi:hypothetical protein